MTIPHFQESGHLDQWRADPERAPKRVIGIYGGVMAAMSFQFGVPAYRRARIR